MRVGIVDTDTSHAVEFTKRLNHIGIAEEQWVDGAQVVAAWTAPSVILPEERHREYNRILREELGVRFVDSLDELRKGVDAVMVLSQDGSVHLARPSLFWKRGCLSSWTNLLPVRSAMRCGWRTSPLSTTPRSSPVRRCVTRWRCNGFTSKRRNGALSSAPMPSRLRQPIRAILACSITAFTAWRRFLP